MGLAHEHNLNFRPPERKPYGIRVSLRPLDPFTRLVGPHWQKFHWYATLRERDEAFDDMASRHRYSRRGDEPSVIYEKVQEAPGRAA